MTTLDPRLASIVSRRSVRAFTTQAVGDDMIELVLQAAMAAPSAESKEPRTRYNTQFVHHDKW